MADMKEIVIYVHGKGGSAAEAGHYRPLFPDAEVVGFDYRAQSPWEAEAEFPPFFAAQRKRCDRLTLIANSIGAFFSMSALDAALVDRAYWISPVVDMEKLIGDMLQWAGVREQELAEEAAVGLGAVSHFGFKLNTVFHKKHGTRFGNHRFIRVQFDFHDLDVFTNNFVVDLV